MLRFLRARAALRALTDPRVATATFLLCWAFVFLTINSTILARGAARWAQSSWDQFAYGAVAAAVPWIIALVPVLVVVSLKQRRWGWFVAITVMGGAFVAYNILGSGGAISTSRSDSISERKFSASRQKDAAQRRERIQNQIDAIDKKTRPAASIAALMEKEKATRHWDRTDGCKDGSMAPNFCNNYRKLEAEHGSAVRLEKLTVALGEIDDKTVVAGWAAEIVDPTAQFWATWTGLSEPTVQMLLPLTTPIVLELGSWILLGAALMLYGLTHHAFLFGASASRTVAAPLTAVALPALPTLAGGAAAKLSAINQPVQLAEWLFSQCARPVPSGGLPEAKWYEHYLALCNQQNVTPLGLDDFREVAKRQRVMMSVIDGQWFYERILPYVPKSA